MMKSKNWYEENRKFLLEFEKTDLFKSYRSLRTLILTKRSSLSPRTLQTLIKIKNSLKKEIKRSKIRVKLKLYMDTLTKSGEILGF